MDLLWPTIYRDGADIEFADQAFRWTNQARGKRVSLCVIVGLSPGSVRAANRLYADQSKRRSKDHPLSDGGNVADDRPLKGELAYQRVCRQCVSAACPTTGVD